MQAADIGKPIDKKLYKGTNPSCHDFNAATATQDTTHLLIGFTTGQIQLVQPGRREPGKLFNEDVSGTSPPKRRSLTDPPCFPAPD